MGLSTGLYKDAESVRLGCRCPSSRLHARRQQGRESLRYLRGGHERRQPPHPRLAHAERLRADAHDASGSAPTQAGAVII